VDQAVTGTKVQMIGIGELDLTFQLAQLHGVDTALNGGTCTHVHKNGGLNVTVYGMEHTPARTAFLFEKFEHIGSFLSINVFGSSNPPAHGRA
jgi:hypothetical protein